MQHFIKVIKIIGIILFITCIVFGGHVLIQGLVQPFLKKLELGLVYPMPEEYNNIILGAAYTTALFPVSIFLFLYYHVGHLLLIKNKFIKAIVLTLIKLEFNQQLIRQPFMDWIMHVEVHAEYPFLIAILRSLDVWIPNLVLCFFVVFIFKHKQERNFNQ